MTYAVPQKGSPGHEPIVAGLLSFLMLGLGQAYNGDRGKAYRFFAFPVLVSIGYAGYLIATHQAPLRGESLPMTPATAGLYAVLTAIWLYGIVEAHQTAGRIRRGDEPGPDSPGRAAVGYIVKLALLLILLPLVVTIGAVIFVLVVRGGR
jgi:hypothetical protein